MLEDIEVRIVGDDILSINSYSTIHKLIVIGIGIYQPEMVVNLLKDGCIQAHNCLYHITANLRCSLLSQDFLVLVKNVRVDA